MLDLLKAEFGEIFVPKAVYDEVTSNELKGSNEVKDADLVLPDDLAGRRAA